MSLNLTLTGAVEITPEEFQRHYLDALLVTACNEGSAPLYVGSASEPGKGLVVALAGSVSPVFAVIRNVVLTDKREVRERILEADGAWAEFLEMVGEFSPEILAEIYDQIAIICLPDVLAGKAETADAVWLTHWIRYRAGAPKLTLEECMRLFGDTPELSTTAGAASLDWETPQRIMGARPDFARRKQIAQTIAEHELNDVVEKFAGSVNAAFLAELVKKDS